MMDKPMFVDRRNPFGRDHVILRCACLAEITVEDLERGYCIECSRALEVVVGANPIKT